MRELYIDQKGNLVQRVKGYPRRCTGCKYQDVEGGCRGPDGNRPIDHKTGHFVPCEVYDSNLDNAIDYVFVDVEDKQ